MTVHPLIAALRKHKSGVVLIALQIALTLAIVCNAIFIIYTRIDKVNQPSGIDESNLLIVTQQYVGAPDADTPAGLTQTDTMLRADMDTLRRLPDVESVASITSTPLLNESWTGEAALKPGSDSSGKKAHSIFYLGDDQVIATLGTHLIAGRNFTPSEIRAQSMRDQRPPTVVIITKHLADKLFDGGNALGKTLYYDGSSEPTTVIGIVDRLESSSAGFGAQFRWDCSIMPARIDASFSRYIVRTRPGREDAVRQSITQALYRTNPMRVIDEDDGIKSFTQVRTAAYRADIGMAILMGIVCVILLGVTAAGIVGLTSFWVGQRHRQIGVRRALGARKIDILHYFQMENLLIAGVGAVVGIGLAIGLNRLLMDAFEMDSMPLYYVLAGLVLILALGQGAVFVPARRASQVQPVVAIRSA